MKHSGIQTKRLSGKRNKLKKMYARTKNKTRRKKQRAATGVGMPKGIGTESPSVGIARALVIILLLHVGAIAAIFIHSKMSKEKYVEIETAQGNFQLIEDDGASNLYYVKSGDTYERVAYTLGVDSLELRKENKNVRLKPGMSLVIPAKNTVKIDQVREDFFESMSEPVRVERVDRVITKRNGATREVSKYKVRSGDTIWTIAEKYKVSQQSIIELNGIKDPNKLRLGQELKIPKS